MQACEINELVKCSQDELYFIMTYFKADNPFSGFSTLNLEVKQLNILNKVINKHLILDRIKERQIGTSTILVAHALWLALFKPDQRIIFMNPNHAQSANARFIIKQAVVDLPFFMRPNIITDHKESMEFDNGSWIHFTNGDSNHLRGVNTTLIIADTFGYFKDEWQRDLRRHANAFGLETEELLKV